MRFDELVAVLSNYDASEVTVKDITTQVPHLYNLNDVIQHRDASELITKAGNYEVLDFNLYERKVTIKHRDTDALTYEKLRKWQNTVMNK